MQIYRNRYKMRSVDEVERSIFFTSALICVKLQLKIGAGSGVDEDGDGEAAIHQFSLFLKFEKLA